MTVQRTNHGGLEWAEDTLGVDFQACTISLGTDPDGEGFVQATLVRRLPPVPPRAAVLYVHGWSDYFFQAALAEYFTDQGFAFYALDLRKCGRSHQSGQTRHYVSDLAMYDAELDASLEIMRRDTAGEPAPVLVLGHSTGALIQSLWLDRVNRRPGGLARAGVAGFVANGPWLDLQGEPWQRTIGTHAIAAASRVRPFAQVPLPESNGYGFSLHHTERGEWDFDLHHKPHASFPVTVGWLTAIRRAQATLHRGLDIEVPTLVLRSGKSVFSRDYRPEIDRADCVVDVRHIARWAPALGSRDLTLRTIEGARHDAFLSQADAREAAYDALSEWLSTRMPAVQRHR